MNDPLMVRLVSERLVLRELRSDDWSEARAIDTDPEAVHFLSSDLCDEAATRAYLDKSIAQAQARPRLLFELAITRRGDDRFIGRVGYRIERPEHREAQIWCALRRDTWNLGYALEAGQLLLTHAFEVSRMHRVYGDCDPRNRGSARVMEKLGMRREGHLRQNWWLKGEWCDSLIFALLEDEWREGRKHQEKQ